MRLGVIVVVALAACSRGGGSTVPLELRSAKAGGFATRAEPPGAYDPIALAKSSIGKVSNPDANIPPPCYAKSDGTANTCWTCHTHSEYPNLADDWELQQNYAFPATAMTNPWKNQFRDRTALVRDISDADVLAYVRTDNYVPLRATLAGRPELAGWRPDVDITAFGPDGFARDGSGWRAIRYKPFPGGFWATNGSADDVFIRLPEMFRRDVAGKASLDVYRTNFAILEAAIAGQGAREIEPIDERAGGLDLDGDGKLGVARRIATLPARFVGGAAGVAVTRAMYPAGVELLHTVRYLDPDAPGYVARRMKEVRYAKKLAVLGEHEIVKAYDALEQPPDDSAPPYGGDPLTGLRNDFGWQLQGWIEDGRGWLRLQTQEEHQYCMGCHTGLGVTVDQTFAFPRKVPGAAGWGVQDPRGIADAPQVGHTEPEYATYLARVGGGDDLRANGELQSRYFRAGQLDPAALADMRGDISRLVLPSRARAIDLDRSYLANVIEQSYVWGRDASVTPAQNVIPRVEGDRSTGIGEADRTVRDGRLHLAW